MLGSGTAGDPYIIENLTDLQNVNLDLTAYYELGGDIDASPTVGWNAGLGFLPIGDVATPFTGHFDGKGYTISGLYINRSATKWVGLFGRILGATFQGVNMVNVDITSTFGAPGIYGSVAGLIAFADGGAPTPSEAANCSVSGVVNGSTLYSDGVGLVIGWWVGWSNSPLSGLSASGTINGGHTAMGGVIGCYNYFGSTLGLTNCHADVTMNCGNRGEVGGLVGICANSIISCYATGNITASGRAGGLVGRYYSGYIRNCYATGNINGGGSWGHGGLAGAVTAAMLGTEISRCYATGNVITSGYEAGGLVGYIYVADPAFSFIMQECFSVGDVVGDDEVGGFIGSIWNGDQDTGKLTVDVEDCYSRGNVSKTNGIVDGMGGFIGANGYDWGGGDYQCGGDIRRCYSTGLVAGSGVGIGGFCGRNDFFGTITGCFWDTQTSGQAASAGGTGGTTAQLKTLATFTGAGWDFNAVWALAGIICNDEYPCLLNVTPLCSPVTPTTARLGDAVLAALLSD